MAHILEAPWEYDTAPFQITDNVWYVGTTQVGSHLIDTGDGLVLLDTGWPNTLYLLLESIRGETRLAVIEDGKLAEIHIQRPNADGRGMLLHQGCRSFTLWTGREAPVEAMREALAQGLA